MDHIIDILTKTRNRLKLCCKNCIFVIKFSQNYDLAPPPLNQVSGIVPVVLCLEFGTYMQIRCVV